MKLKELFPGYGNKITVNNFNELYKIVKNIDPKVYQKDYNPTDRERYYILHLLPLYSIYELISYPLAIECIDTGEHCNMPDFKITDNYKEYILEAIMGTTEEYIEQSKALALQDKTYNSYKVWVENGKARVELYEEESDGFIYGWEADKAFGVIVSDSIIKKTKILPRYDIEKGIGKELLVYYNFPGWINLDYAVPFLIENLQAKDYHLKEPKFDKIHIQKDNYVLYDILGKDSKELHIYSLYDYLENLQTENLIKN